jgi:hypothetical protein
MILLFIHLPDFPTTSSITLVNAWEIRLDPWTASDFLSNSVPLSELCRCNKHAEGNVNNLVIRSFLSAV